MGQGGQGQSHEQGRGQGQGTEQEADAMDQEAMKRALQEEHRRGVMLEESSAMAMGHGGFTGGAGW